MIEFRSSPDDLRSPIEVAIGAMRTVALVIVLTVWAGYRPTGATEPLHRIGAIGLLLLLGAATVLTAVAGTRRWPSRLLPVGMQTIDIVIAIVAMQVLEPQLGDSTWLVALIPLMAGGLRFGPIGTLATWVVLSFFYLTVIFTGIMVDPTVPLDLGQIFKRLGLILAIALPVGSVTQWLTSQWHRQRVATQRAEIQIDRLHVVADCGRAMAFASTPAVLRACASGAVALGFDSACITATQSGDPRVLARAGTNRDDFDAAEDVIPGLDEAVVTGWPASDDDRPTTTASVVVDDRNRFRLHAWSTETPDDDLVEALHLLAMQARSAVLRAESLEQVRRQANRDPLTGLANRRVFSRQLTQLAQSPRAVTLLYIDFDRFKQVNDIHGHLAGDELLRIAGRRIANQVPTNALVARIGGDEFAVILPDVSRRPDAAAVADAICDAMAQPMQLRRTAVELTLSVGVAVTVGQGDARFVVAAADAALLAAKSGGRARVEFAPAVGVDQVSSISAPHEPMESS